MPFLILFVPHQYISKITASDPTEAARAKAIWPRKLKSIGISLEKDQEWVLNFWVRGALMMISPKVQRENLGSWCWTAGYADESMLRVRSTGLGLGG